MTGFDRFKKVSENIGTTLAIATGGGLIAFAASFADLDPPKPGNIPVITALAMLITLIFIFQFLDGRGKAAASRAMVRGLILAIVSALGYFVILSIFVFKIPTTGERIFVGCGWESNAAQIAEKFLADPASGCPGNYKALLESAQYEAKMIWSQTGLTAIEMAGLISWLTLFVGIAMIVAAFVTYQTKAK